ncbi:DUF4250 domain-containing protein [Clostridium vitabionis]|jgi:hypothetical protein|uniref:DUF4250 domain-containing protein n=1 Tax=Clostridium vitabionis TaxID=2784388 RepID=UPI00188AD3F8|nr:DUF4250 domain-containing protein [Clostridium vitabionis]
MSIPKDPFLAVSFVNTELRDSYDSLDALCASCGVDRKALEEKLALAGFSYDEAQRRFR